MSRAWAAAPVTSGNVRDIPRLCSCDWSIRYLRSRPAGWERAKADPACGFHGKAAAR